MTRSLCLGLVLAVFAVGPIAVAPAAEPIELVVLDVEITGDLGGPELAAEHESRLKIANTKLRASLARTGLYRLVDNATAQEAIDQLKSRHRYLHDCNGCDLDIGRQLGADQVMVAWVTRVSALILTLTYEIHDVSSGQIVARKSFDFRGDNDTAWARAIDYMVRDLKESPPPAQAASTPARLTIGEESIEELIEVPDDLALGRYRVFCDGVILPGGGAENFYCYGSDAPTSLVKATTRAARQARFIPATLNDKTLSVRMSLTAIVQITKDKDDPLVLVVPNNGADAERYRLFYTAPQRYNSFRWRMDQFVPQPRENVRVLMNMSIDEHGEVTQHSVQNVSGAEPALLGVIERRMASMKFIPGFFRRKPAPMLYTEVMYLGSIDIYMDQQGGLLP